MGGGTSEVCCCSGTVDETVPGEEFWGWVGVTWAWFDGGQGSGGSI